MRQLSTPVPALAPIGEATRLTVPLLSLAAAPQMQIFARSVAGSTLTLECSASASVGELCQALCRKDGIEAVADELRLVLEGKQLEEACALADCGVVDGACRATLHSADLPAAAFLWTAAALRWLAPLHRRPCWMMVIDADGHPFSVRSLQAAPCTCCPASAVASSSRR